MVLAKYFYGYALSLLTGNLRTFEFYELFHIQGKTLTIYRKKDSYSHGCSEFNWFKMFQSLIWFYQRLL